MVHADGHNFPGSDPNPHMNKFAFGCAIVASIISIIFGYGNILTFSTYQTKVFYIYHIKIYSMELY